MEKLGLPWCPMWPLPQCRARLSKREGREYWGRCELKPHSDDIEHALERGMIWVRWKNGPVRWETPHYD